MSSTASVDSKRLWVQGFLASDPRNRIADFFRQGDERGPCGYLRRLREKPHGERSQHFSVWRPTSLDALRMLFDGSACGKGLNIKGKSALEGKLSGFVPFLQISEEAHKAKVSTAPPSARIRIFYRSQRLRDAARATLDGVLAEMREKVRESEAFLLQGKDSMTDM